MALAEIVSHIPRHVALHIVNKTPKALKDGLFDKGLDDIAGLAGAGSSDYLDVHME